MRFQIKKLLEGYDPADLIEQSMYCFGSDDSTSDSGEGLSDESIEAQERGVDISQSRGFSSPEDEVNYNMAQADIQNRFMSGQALGDNLNNFARDMPNILETQDFAREQNYFDANPMSTLANAPYTSRSEEINVGAGDVFGLKNQIANKLSKGGTPYFNTQGDIIGATGQTPMFGIPFLPNVRTYTGLNSGNPFGDPTIGSDESTPETVAPTRNPVSGQPVCPDGYRFDNDLQACRLDTSSTNMPTNPNPVPSGDAYYRATSLDNVPMNVPSGFDFNKANQNFIDSFAYRPANFTNQMSLTGFTPFRRS